MCASPTKRQSTGPRFVRYFGPVLDALRNLGGTARPDDVANLVASSVGISTTEQNELNKSGQSRFRNHLHWARFYLVKAGLIEASERGVWSLNKTGHDTNLDHAAALQVFHDVHSKWQRKGTAQDPRIAEIETLDSTPEQVTAIASQGYRESLIDVLRTLPPAGFEAVCRRLLLESGFETVEVTGRSGDGGIDGHGILLMNPFVSFRVLFQCKRYGHPVTPEKVRDFRGAMTGRADKGIILTTSSFTRDAREEATRDGAPPIELVDADKLVLMFETLKLGLMPIKSYEIDYDFFQQFE